jgi:DNA-directed RNA polymerase specialized sigma24 family protein
MSADDRDTIRSSLARPSGLPARRPELPDVAPNEAVGDFGADADVLSDDYPAADITAAGDWRHYNRQLLREFLRSVPRAEATATLVLVRADGTPRLITRAQLSAAVDRLRPRQRQIVRLTLEERWSRQRVCTYLNNISLKTLMRDQNEALDSLAEL